MPLEGVPKMPTPFETIRLFSRRLDRELVDHPCVHGPVVSLRRQQHIAAFRMRLRLAERSLNDPYMQLGCLIEVPIHLIRRHTVVPGYYPTKRPAACIPGDWDTDGWIIDEHPYYNELREAVQGKLPWETTQVHERFFGPAYATPRGWRREELLMEAREKIERYEQMYACMREEGFLTQAQLAARRPRSYVPLQFDEISIGVARDGELQLCEGNHRFTIAKAAGIATLPVWVALRHTEWCAFRRALAHEIAVRGGRAPEPLLHQDLTTYPHDPSCVRLFELVRKTLPAGAGNLVDVTPGWGYFAQRCEELGYDCAVVAGDPREVELLDRLRIAGGRTFSVLCSLDEASARCGSVRVVLGVRQFDDRLRSQSERAQFEAFLSATQPKIILLDSSREDACYWAEKAGLSQVDAVSDACGTIQRLS